MYLHVGIYPAALIPAPDFYSISIGCIPVIIPVYSSSLSVFVVRGNGVSTSEYARSLGVSIFLFLFIFFFPQSTHSHQRQCLHSRTPSTHLGALMTSLPARGRRSEFRTQTSLCIPRTSRMMHRQCFIGKATRIKVGLYIT